MLPSFIRTQYWRYNQRVPLGSDRSCDVSCSDSGPLPNFAGGIPALASIRKLGTEAQQIKGFSDIHLLFSQFLNVSIPSFVRGAAR